MNAARKTAWILALGLVLPWVVAFDARAQGDLRFDARGTLQPNGDAVIDYRMTFDRANYAQVKTRIPNPFQFLRDFTSGRADYEIADGADCRYEDATSSLVLRLTELGAVKNRGEGEWELPLAPGPHFVTLKEEGGAWSAHFYEVQKQADGEVWHGTHAYVFPNGAREVTWDPSDRVLRYTLPFAGGEGAGRLRVDFRTKDRMMTCLYKVYGLGVQGDANFAAQWVSKAVLRNTGRNAIHDLRVRYRVAGYSEWSLWDKFPEVVPGQTAVSVYYPVLDRSIAEIRTNTPVNVLVEWEYTDGEGRERKDGDGARTVLLGVNEFVFSNLVAGESFGTWHDEHNNAPLLAAWVSRNDPVIKEFAAMANKLAGGVAASSDDANALRALQACYELMQANDFTYQHPPALIDRSNGFDPKMVQNVKFPRDVIRDKSGTCIDLAILYASMANAIGLHPALAVIPGHCFPVITLPSGALIGVEVTGVGGGLRAGTAPFAKVLELGNQELRESVQNGRIHLVDVQDLWTRGISNPELEPLPADILSRWKIAVPTATGGGADASPASGSSPFAGTWVGQASETLQNGQTITYPVAFVIQVQGDQAQAEAAIRAQVPSDQGTVVTIQVTETYSGRVQGGALLLQGQQKTMQVLPDGPTQSMTVDDARAEVRGTDLVIRVGNGEDGYTTITLQRQ